MQEYDINSGKSIAEAMVFMAQESLSNRMVVVPDQSSDPCESWWEKVQGDKNTAFARETSDEAYLRDPMILSAINGEFEGQGISAKCLSVFLEANFWNLKDSATMEVAIDLGRDTNLGMLILNSTNPQSFVEMRKELNKIGLNHASDRRLLETLKDFSLRGQQYLAIQEKMAAKGNASKKLNELPSTERQFLVAERQTENGKLQIFDPSVAATPKEKMLAKDLAKFKLLDSEFKFFADELQGYNDFEKSNLLFKLNDL